jgi:hypothetical protein
VVLRSACTPAAVTQMQLVRSRNASEGRLITARSPSADTKTHPARRECSKAAHYSHTIVRHRVPGVVGYQLELQRGDSRERPASVNTVSSVAGSPPARLTTTRITMASWWYFHPLHTSRIVAEASHPRRLRLEVPSAQQPPAPLAPSPAGPPADPPTRCPPPLPHTAAVLARVPSPPENPGGRWRGSTRSSPSVSVPLRPPSVLVECPRIQLRGSYRGRSDAAPHKVNDRASPLPGHNTRCYT